MQTGRENGRVTQTMPSLRIGHLLGQARRTTKTKCRGFYDSVRLILRRAHSDLAGRTFAETDNAQAPFLDWPKQWREEILSNDDLWKATDPSDESPAT